MKKIFLPLTCAAFALFAACSDDDSSSSSDTDDSYIDTELTDDGDDATTDATDSTDSTESADSTDSAGSTASSDSATSSESSEGGSSSDSASGTSSNSETGEATSSNSETGNGEASSESGNASSESESASSSSTSILSSSSYTSSCVIDTSDTFSQYSQSSGTNEVSCVGYRSTGDDEHAVSVTGGSLTMTDVTVLKSGGTEDDDNSSFYGTNAAVYCSGGSIDYTGGYVYVTGDRDTQGANAIFAYDQCTITVSDVYVYTASWRTGRGLHATGGGTIYAYNMDITTTGESSSVMATDKGGGYITVEGGTYKATGNKSAVIYSTGTITVSNITGTSTSGEMADIEGTANIYIKNSDLTCGSSDRGILILQSGSGDAEGYTGVVEVTGGSLTTTNSSAPLIEVPTNETATVTLTDVDLSVASGVLMYVDYNTQWNTSGGTGNLVLSTAGSATYSGDVNADSYSNATVTVESGVTWQGSFNSANSAKSATATISGTWELTADSYLSTLTVNSGATINTNGYTLSYGSKSGSGTIN